MSMRRARFQAGQYHVEHGMKLRSDGKTWQPAGLTLRNDASGVACAGPGAVLIDGFGGLKQRLVNGAWVDDSSAPPFTDLHGAWADPSGAFCSHSVSWRLRIEPSINHRSLLNAEKRKNTPRICTR